MTYKTYDEWNQEGRMIIKGEKATSWCQRENKALFHEDQTKEKSLLYEETDSEFDEGDWYDPFEYSVDNDPFY